MSELPEEFYFDSKLWNKYLGKYLLIFNRNYCSFIQKNALIVSAIVGINTLQLISLINFTIESNSLKSEYTKEFYRDIVPYFKLRNIWEVTDRDLMLALLISQAVLLFLFYLIHVVTIYLEFAGFML